MPLTRTACPPPATTACACYRLKLFGGLILTQSFRYDCPDMVILTGCDNVAGGTSATDSDSVTTTSDQSLFMFQQRVTALGDPPSPSRTPYRLRPGAVLRQPNGTPPPQSNDMGLGQPRQPSDSTRQHDGLSRQRQVSDLRSAGAGAVAAGNQDSRLDEAHQDESARQLSDRQLPDCQLSTMSPAVTVHAAGAAGTPSAVRTSVIAAAQQWWAGPRKKPALKQPASHKSRLAAVPESSSVRHLKMGGGEPALEQPSAPPKPGYEARYGDLAGASCHSRVALQPRVPQHFVCSITQVTSP